MSYQELLEWMSMRFEQEFCRKSAPKYEVLCRVIQQAIQEQLLSPGDRLPPEQQLSGTLPVSQITVRKCFTTLGMRGVISREHGRGTFVSNAEQSVSDLWHFRFWDPATDSLMPIYNRILSLGLHSETSATNSIMSDGEKLIRIERAVNIGSRFTCYSELFLPLNKFSGILDLPLSELERVNLKDILSEMFHAPTLRVDQMLKIASLPRRASEPIGQQAGAKVMLLRVVGYSFEDEVISHQDIWIPETEYELNLPASGKTERPAKSGKPSLKVVSKNAEK